MDYNLKWLKGKKKNKAAFKERIDKNSEIKYVVDCNCSVIFI
jgi:hypothetical protein